MAKRETPQPLTIMVAPAFINRPAIRGLQKAGHTVLPWVELGREVDLILHPHAHLFNDMMWDYLPAAVAAARKRRRSRRDTCGTP